MSSYLMIFVFKMGNEKKLEDDSIFVYIEHHTTFIPLITKTLSRYREPSVLSAIEVPKYNLKVSFQDVLARRKQKVESNMLFILLTIK